MGWLQKHSRRGMYKGSRKRFFTLKGSTLEYYKDDTCKNLRSKMPVKAGTFVTRMTKTMFTVSYDGQTISLVAADEELCDSWVEALQLRVDMAAAVVAKEEPSLLDDD